MRQDWLDQALCVPSAVSVAMAQCPVFGGLVFRGDGRRQSTGREPTIVDNVLHLGDNTSSQTIWLRDGQEFPTAVLSIYVGLFFDDFCNMKNLPKNPRFPSLAGDVCAAFLMDLEAEGDDDLDTKIVSLPILDIFSVASLQTMFQHVASGSSNRLDLPFNREPILAAIQQQQPAACSLNSGVQ